MRQVPEYLIIGNGRVARHFQHYFSLLKLSYRSWNRTESLELLHQHLTQSTHVLLLISDKAIEDFAKHYLTQNIVKIHFSGGLVSHQVMGAHPLMTFSDDLYSLEQYLQIPFIIDNDALEFSKLLPGLPNQHVRLAKSLKAKYHALCVLSGNFSCILWQKFYSEMENEFKFPRDMLHPYLKQQTQNLIHDVQSALTGPLVRNDIQTIEKNISALSNDPFQEVYKSFVACYQALTAKERV